MSILQRKTSTSVAASAKDKEKKKEPTSISKTPQRKVSSEDNSIVNPVLAGIIQRSNPQTTTPTPVTSATPAKSPAGDSFKAVAKSAVGRGIRHSFTAKALPPVASAVASRPDETLSETPLEAKVKRDSSRDNLSQLATNYRNSLIDYRGDGDTDTEEFQFDADPTPLSQMQGDPSASSGFFSRDASLLELAMIPEVEEAGGQSSVAAFNFVDFPNPEVRPKSSGWEDNDV